MQWQYSHNYPEPQFRNLTSACSPSSSAWESPSSQQPSVQARWQLCGAKVNLLRRVGDKERNLPVLLRLSGLFLRHPLPELCLQLGVVLVELHSATASAMLVPTEPP